jgi:hypothetical protein
LIPFDISQNLACSLLARSISLPFTRGPCQHQVTALRAQPIPAPSRPSKPSSPVFRASHALSPPRVCQSPLHMNLEFLRPVRFRTLPTNCGITCNIRPHAAPLTPDYRTSLVYTARGHLQQQQVKRYTQTPIIVFGSCTFGQKYIRIPSRLTTVPFCVSSSCAE